MLTTFQRAMKEHRAMSDGNDTCMYCLHPKSHHYERRGGCGHCECFLFVSVTAWLAEGRRANTPDPNARPREYGEAEDHLDMIRESRGEED